jgi:hypothetical protein
MRDRSCLSPENGIRPPTAAVVYQGESGEAEGAERIGLITENQAAGFPTMIPVCIRFSLHLTHST